VSFTPAERRLLALSDRIEARPYVKRADTIKAEQIIGALRSTASIADASRKLGFPRASNFYRFMANQGIRAHRRGGFLVITVRIKEGSP
jgi:hypothetical protein